jgi:autotransporter-associated beta strand protein
MTSGGRRASLLRATAMATGVIAAMMLFQPAPARAQVPFYTWSGNTSSVATLGSNWSGGVAPAIGGGFEINVNGYNNSPPTFAAGSYGWTKLTVNLQNRAVMGEDTVTLTGPSTFGRPDVGQSFFGIVNSGRLDIQSGVDFRIARLGLGGTPTGRITVNDNGTLYNRGTIGVFVSNSGSFTNHVGGVIGANDLDTPVSNTRGTVDAYNQPNLLVGFNGEKAGFFNYGTITGSTQSGAGTNPNPGSQRYAVSNSGYFVNGVTGATNGSTFGVINNGAMNTNGYFENQGIINGFSAVSGGTFSNGALFTAVDFNGNVTGEARVSGTLDGMSVIGGTFLNYGAVVNGVDNWTGTTTNLGTIKKAWVSGGTFNNAVRVINDFPPATAETLRGVITNDVTQIGGTFNNSGDINGFTIVNGGLLDNKSGGVIASLQAGAASGSVAGTVTNSGSMTVASTTGPASLTNKSGGSIGSVGNGGTFINELGATVTGNVINNNSDTNLVKSANFGMIGGNLTVDGGSFTQAGTLTGTASVNAGGTLIFGSSAANGNLSSNLRGGGGGLVNNGKVVFDGTLRDTVISTVISGTGSVENRGGGLSGGTLFEAAQTYTGKTLVTGGRLTFNSTAATSEIAVSDGAFVVFNVAANESRVFNTYVTGAGGFVKSGAGELTVAGLGNTGVVAANGGRMGFTGPVNNGISVSSVLEVANNAEIALGSTNMKVGGLRGQTGTFTGMGNIEITSAAGTTNQFAGILSGAGRNITKLGAGTQELYGANTYTGDTIILAGILKVGSSGALGNTTRAVQVESGANIEFGTLGNFVLPNGASDFTFDRIITGAGGLIKTSTNTVTLTAANTYTGDTWIKEGTLKLAGNGAVALASTIKVESGAKFDIGSTQFSTSTINNITGDMVGTGGTLTLNFANNQTYSGKISNGLNPTDTFKLVIDGGGALTLNGDNSFTGGIVIQGHGTNLILGHNNAAGGANNTILTRGSTVTYANGVNNNTPITIDSQTTQLQVNGSDTATQSGVISEAFITGPLPPVGEGRPLEKIGTGTLFLSAGPGIPLINTYSGATTITAGTVQIDNTRNLGTDAASNRLVFNGGTLQSRADITMARGVTVNATGGTVWADNNTGSLQKLDFSNGIQFNNGTLTKIGGGQLHVGGVGGGAGTLKIDNGALFLNSGAALGSASIRFAGNTTLSTAATTPVNFANAVQVDAQVLVTNPANTSITLSGPVTGVGSFSKTNTGTFNLTGNNSFTGGVTLGAGTLGVGSNTALGARDMSAATQTTLKALANVSIANNIVLTPSAGFGTQNLIVDTNSFNMTLSGVISKGAGFDPGTEPGLTKNGAGTLTLSGVNTYRGATIVNAGKLVVNGSIANTSSVTIADGATLGGNAAIPNLTVQNGARLSPGNSIGTVNIAGNLTLNAGSTTVIEIQQNLSDRIIAGGTAQIAGTLQLVALGGPYVFASPYTIITATGGRNGTFGTVNTDAAFGVGVTSTVLYGATTVQVVLNAAPLAQTATTLALTRPKNVFAVASGMDRAVANGANPSAFFNVYNQPTREALAAAVNSLSGEVHTSANAMGVKASDQFMRVMLDPFALGRDASLMNTAGGGFGDAAFASNKGAGKDAGETIRSGSGLEAFIAQAPLQARRFAVWGAANGQTARGDADAITVGSSRLSASDGHLAIGADMGIAPGIIAGVAFSGGQGDARLANGLGSAKADIYQAGLYAMGRFGALSFGATGSYGSIQTETNRSIPVLGLGAVKADYRAESWSGRLEAAYAAMRLAGFGISPTAALQAQSVKTPAFMEINGASGLPAGVVSQGKTNATVRSELGLKFDYVALVGGADVNIYISAAWGHYYARDAKFAGSLVGLTGSAFTVEGVRPSRDVALIAAGADMKVGPNMHLGARFDTEQGSANRSYAGSAKLRMAF